MPGFEIDSRKLRSAAPPVDGPWWEGFKWLGAIVGIAFVFIAGLGLAALGVIRALA